MTIEQLKTRVSVAIRAVTPNAVIQISPLSENDGDLGVSVFAVEHGNVRTVKDIILNLDGELCVGTEFSLTPMVRDMATTRKHYPQFLPV